MTYLHVGYDIDHNEGDHYTNKIRQHLAIKLDTDPNTLNYIAIFTPELLQDMVSLINSGKMHNVKSLISNLENEFI